MRLALVTTSFLPKRGGLELAVHGLANALTTRGHDVVVFARATRQNGQEAPGAYRLVRFGLARRGADRLGINRVMLDRIFGRLHSETPFDAINVHSAFTAATYAHHVGKRYGVPVVVTCQGADIQVSREFDYGYRLDTRKDRIIRRNLENADRVIAISESVYDDIASIVSSSRIVSAPNGVDVTSFRRGCRCCLKEQLGIEDGIVVVSLGRNVPKKCFDAGVRAIADAVHRNTAFHYVHVGRNAEPLEHLASALGIADHFHALGQIDHSELVNVLHGADIYLSPAAVEGFSLANVEAMAAGLPCVLTDGPGNRDAGIHGTNSWIVPVGDVRAMADAIVKLGRDPAARQSFGRASRELAEERYDWARIAGEYERTMAAVSAA